MRLKSVVFIVFVLLFIVGCSQSASEVVKPDVKPNVTPDFRNVTWGMSMDDVKKVEDAEFRLEMDSSLFYRVTLDKSEFDLMYFFIDDKLYEANYITNDYSTAKFDRFKEMLIEKYGEPVRDEKDDKHEFAEWKINDTNIIISHLIENNNEFIIKYSSEKYNSEKQLNLYKKI